MSYLLAATKRSNLNSCSGQYTLKNIVLSTAEVQLDVNTNAGCTVWRRLSHRLLCSVKLTEFVISPTLAQGNGSGRFWLATCAILHGMRVFNIALVQMVCYGPPVCVNIATGWNLAKPEQSWGTVIAYCARNIFEAWLLHLWASSAAFWKCFITCLRGTCCTSETQKALYEERAVWRLCSCMHLRTYLGLCWLNSLPVLPPGYLPFFSQATPEKQR